jgi:hypothetical protein
LARAFAALVHFNSREEPEPSCTAYLEPTTASNAPRSCDYAAASDIWWEFFHGLAAETDIADLAPKAWYHDIAEKCSRPSLVL